VLMVWCSLMRDELWSGIPGRDGGNQRGQNNGRQHCRAELRKI